MHAAPDSVGAVVVVVVVGRRVALGLAPDKECIFSLNLNVFWSHPFDKFIML